MDDLLGKERGGSTETDDQAKEEVVGVVVAFGAEAVEAAAEEGKISPAGPK